MKVLMLGMAVVAPLLLCFITVHQAFSNSCSGTCCGYDFVAWSPNPSNVSAGGTGSFSTTVTFNWCWTTSDRSLLYDGFVRENGNSMNIVLGTNNPSYVPNTFAPDKTNCCAEGIQVSISGDLSNPNLNGTLKTYGDIAWPVNYQIHTTNVTH